VDQLHGLRVYISYLRKKLEVTQGRLAIETTGSLGYRLQLRSGGRTRLEVSVPREVLEPSDGVPESIQWANGRV